MISSQRLSMNWRTLLASTAAAMLSAPAIARAQGGALKVGVLLPRSGLQAFIGRDCQRGVELAPPILKDLGLPDLAIMNADTEFNVDTARARAEKLISEGAQLLIGAFDSGDTTAIAQVAEQKGIPLVINIAASPAITEQGYKFVFRNFPTAPMILNDAFMNQKEVFAVAGVAPKTVALMHVNDTFGSAMAKGIGSIMPKYDMPYTIIESIGYDPAARDLSVELAKAKASGAEALMVMSRANDAILLTREMIKQRWSPMAILSMGPGWNENDYFKTLGKLADGPMSFIPWYDPTKRLAKRLIGALALSYPGINMDEKHFYTFEALLIAADAFKRAGVPIQRRSAMQFERPTLPTTSVWDPVSSSTKKGRTTSSRTGPSKIALASSLSLGPRRNQMQSPSCR